MIEWLHQTLESMLCTYCLDSGNEWDEGIPFLLLAIREAVQELQDLVQRNWCLIILCVVH